MATCWPRAGYARTALGCAVIGCVLVLAGCGALGKLGAAHYPKAKAYTVTGPVTTLVIEGGGGSIDVDGSARSGVRVSEQSSYSTKPPVARHVLTGTTLTLSYTCPSQLNCDISYTVRVPRGTGVRASTSSGAITLTSVAGPVAARAGAGLITAVDLRSRQASFSADAGGVVAAFDAAPTSLRASTDLGSITLTVPGTVAYRISTHTVLGTSTIGVRKSATSSHAITARSDVGSVSISPS